MDLYPALQSLVDQIPSGRVATCAGLARALGDPRAAPVVRRWADAHGPEQVVDDTVGHVDVFTAFNTDFPLEELRREQRALRRRVVLKDDCGPVETVAGVDVAYAGDLAYGAYVEMNAEGETLRSDRVSMAVRFPYIPTYLAYREGPVLEGLLRGRRPSLVMVDGNGVLHPRGCGLACHLGVTHDLPVIGVAKSLLCGEVRDGGGIYMDGELVGMAVGEGRPVYVSPGHRVTVGTAAMVTRSRQRHRIPEPLHRAHLLATRAKNENAL
ncbi:MAG: endonuclease V [Candidatus Thermoplasmatota archaeon]|nr:endonuclease V [Candidatus Thermoplasmatota archaeon]